MTIGILPDELQEVTVPALSRDVSCISRGQMDPDEKESGGISEPMTVSVQTPKLGDWVRVKPSVVQPKHHWGRVSYSLKPTD